MALSYNIEKSVLPFGISGHVAVTWNNGTLIWGGHSWDFRLHYYHRGKWTQIETSGHLPKWGKCYGAHVINDNMYVLGEDNNRTTGIFSLHLHTWTWTMSIPSGTLPTVRWGIRSTSWVYDNKIYFFGYKYIYQWSNQLFCYNISTNSWECPESKGEIPSPRISALTTITDNTVFLFGGFNGSGLLNDLHILDMPSMIWKKVHGNMLSGQGPSDSTFSPTLTNICRSKAALIGMSRDIIQDDCWLLNLQNAKELMNPSSIWTKIPFPYSRSDHAAVLQPLSKRLWVIGGLNTRSNLSVQSNILKLNFKKIHSLKNIAMEYVARNICAHDPRLAPDQLSRQLRDEIEAYRCEMGDQCDCPEWTRGNMHVFRKKFVH